MQVEKDIDNEVKANKFTKKNKKNFPKKSI